MGGLQIFVLGLWLTWVAALLLCRAGTLRLSKLLREFDPAGRELLVFPQGAPKLLEPFRWYLRIRRFVYQEAPSAAQATELDVMTGRLRQLLGFVEIGFVALAAVIAMVTVQNILAGTFSLK